MDAELSINAAQPLTATRPASGLALSRRLPVWFVQIVQAGMILGIAVSSYLFVSHFVVQSVRVTGASMQPTLRHGQTCLLNRWVYHVRAPRQGDVVVLRDPSDQGLAVKRIVGVAGDEIELKHNGEIYRNGKPLAEAYLEPGVKTYPGPKFRHQTLKCPPGGFIVLGDNRMNSADSRNYGPVAADNILGLIVP